MKNLNYLNIKNQKNQVTEMPVQPCSDYPPLKKYISCIIITPYYIFHWTKDYSAVPFPFTPLIFFIIGR